MAALFVEFFLPDDQPQILDELGSCYEQTSYSNRLLKKVGKASKMNGTNPSDFAIMDKCFGYSPQRPAYTKPVVLLVNSLCQSTGEGIAMGFNKMPRCALHQSTVTFCSGSHSIRCRRRSRVQIVGFHGTAGSFGMSGGRILLAHNAGMQFPFGRSLDVNRQIQIDSDATLEGGIHATVRIPYNASIATAFVRSRVTGEGDVELDFAQAVLRNMTTTDRLRQLPSLSTHR